MRIVPAAEAVAGIRSGDQVFVHGGAATPSVLLEALTERAPELRDVGIIHLHTEGPAPHLAPELAASFRHRALFIGGNARLAVNEGRADYVPIFLSDIPELFTSRALPLDAVLLNLSPPDAHGYCSLGTSVDAALAAVATAGLVIAQLNRSMPRTLGDSFVHVRDIDLAVEVDQPPHPHDVGVVGEVERQIGSFVAELVSDRATLQMGIGSIPTAVALALRDKQDLGVHTELFTDSVLDLVEAGAVTGAAKEINRGKIVTAFLMGSQRLYDFVDDNPMIEMRPVDYTNDTARHPPLPAHGGHQLGDQHRPDRAGERGLDRHAVLLRRRRADGLHARRRPGGGGAGDHRPAVDGRGRHGLAHRGGPAARRRRGHDPGACPYRRHRVRGRRALRPHHPRARRGPHRHRAPNRAG